MVIQAVHCRWLTTQQLFGLDIYNTWGTLDLTANLEFEPEIIEENEETKLVRDGNGALLRWLKHKSGTPEHVDFRIKDRTSWEKEIRPYLIDTDNYDQRIDFVKYREEKEKAKDKGMFFTMASLNVFECMHPVCGHETLLMNMALDPDWIKDMCEIYGGLLIDLMEILFEKEGIPDGVFFYEDLGFKEKPFMSPSMYKEMLFPAHKRTFDYVHSLDLPVILHSCGFVEPLIPDLIKAGIDCLQAIEVKAGMDLVKLKEFYGDKIAFMGGLDARSLLSNDREVIRVELESKLPLVMKQGGYILHSDHSIPPQVEYETYKYFLESGKQMGAFSER